MCHGRARWISRLSDHPSSQKAVAIKQIHAGSLDCLPAAKHEPALAFGALLNESLSKEIIGHDYETRRFVSIGARGSSLMTRSFILASIAPAEGDLCQVPETVVDSFFGDGSVSNASIAFFQKVTDACQRVVDAFFGVGDGSVGTAGLTQ
jgi:hypothetical protein